MNCGRNKKKANEPTITKHILLIWLPTNSHQIYSCDLGGKKVSKIDEGDRGFWQNGTKIFSLNSLDMKCG